MEPTVDFLLKTLKNEPSLLPEIAKTVKKLGLSSQNVLVKAKCDRVGQFMEWCIQSGNQDGYAILANFIHSSDEITPECTKWVTLLLRDLTKRKRLLPGMEISAIVIVNYMAKKEPDSHII